MKEKQVVSKSSQFFKVINDQNCPCSVLKDRVLCDERQARNIIIWIIVHLIFSIPTMLIFLTIHTQNVCRMDCEVNLEGKVYTWRHENSSVLNCFLSFPFLFFKTETKELCSCSQTTQIWEYGNRSTGSRENKWMLGVEFIDNLLELAPQMYYWK